MTLLAGERFGSYEIVAAIGHGGMGEVFSARDLKLQRRVAVKVLPDSLAADPERLARFQREAEVLASLNHPNISAIYGIEESSGRKALILELVEGVTISDRIAQGRIPVDEALAIARQIAEALESAHERGVIHRDLKPSNIKVRDDGAVKVLDFGLAKLMQPGDPSPRASDMSQSPTLTSPALATHAGVILGTAAYMSPEQAKGKPVDRRSDMWAFGCVLYEMLTGKRAFEGEDVSETLAEVLKSVPNWKALPSDTPESIRRLLRRCLAKERVARLSDAAAARLEIDETDPSPVSGPTVASKRRPWLAALLVLYAAAAVLLAIWMSQVGRLPDTAPTRFTIQLPTDVEMPGSATLPLAISRDGRRIAFIAGPDEKRRQLWLRSLAQLEPVPLRGTEAAVGPFFSPDGRWLAYFDGRALKKIPLESGAGLPIPLTNISGFFRGATWGADGTIVFSAAGTGLMRIPDGGGVAQPLTTPTGEVHMRPHFLPSGRTVLFTVMTPGKRAHIAALSLDTGKTSVVVEGEDPRVTRQGFIVFRRGEVLWAAPFDVDRATVIGEPSPMADGLRGAQFDVADNGTFIYTPPRDMMDQRSLVWVDRHGVEQPANFPDRAYVYPRISPDGTQIALDIRDQQNDIWIWHTARQTMDKLTFNAVLDRFPVWSPDGKFVAYTTEGVGISRQPADGTGAGEPLVDSSKNLQTFQGANNAFPSSYSPDGTRLLFWGNATSDMHAVHIASRKSTPVLVTPFNERNPEVSPDGRWLAYESNESGSWEIHVRPFADVSRGKWEVSTEGGTQPLWGRNGRELFFRSPTGAVMQVAIAPGENFSRDVPTRLFEGPYFHSATAIIGRTYDVAPDGQRFLMIKNSRRRPEVGLLMVVENAFAELAK